MTPVGFPHSDTSGSYGCTRLTGAFRSVPRPSSALDTKASTVCPYSLNPCDTEKLMLLLVTFVFCRYVVVNLRPTSSVGEGRRLLCLCPPGECEPLVHIHPANSHCFRLISGLLIKTARYIPGLNFNLPRYTCYCAVM